MGYVVTLVTPGCTDIKALLRTLLWGSDLVLFPLFRRELCFPQPFPPQPAPVTSV